jgi:predicted amidophosphoribosyltransferase
MNIILPINPADECYNQILHLNKDQLVFAIKNYIPKQVLDYPEKRIGRCPNCRKEVNRLDNYCRVCGKSLQHISQ